jgi:hypothetical protein
MSYRGTVDPGIDISHYGAPYKQMLGLDGLGDMLYRYRGMGAWTGAPADDPRMVKRFTVVRATWRAEGLPSGGAAEAASRLHYQGRTLFAGNTVRKIGGTGWIAGGRVGYEVILANSTRAGEIKRKNHEAGVRAARGMGGSVRFVDGRTGIPASGFTASAPGTPAVEESAPTSLPGTETPSLMMQRAAGLPMWGWGVLGVGVLGAVAVALTAGPKKRAAVAANRRRRRRRR